MFSEHHEQFVTAGAGDGGAAQQEGGKTEKVDKPACDAALVPGKENWSMRAGRCLSRSLLISRAQCLMHDK